MSFAMSDNIEMPIDHNSRTENRRIFKSAADAGSVNAQRFFSHTKSVIVEDGTTKLEYDPDDASLTCDVDHLDRDSVHILLGLDVGLGERVGGVVSTFSAANRPSGLRRADRWPEKAPQVWHLLPSEDVEPEPVKSWKDGTLSLNDLPHYVLDLIQK